MQVVNSFKSQKNVPHENCIMAADSPRPLSMSGYHHIS